MLPSNKRILRIVVSLFLVFAMTVFLDFLFEALRRKEANKTVAEYAYASSNFSLAVQDLYFEDPAYKTNPIYLDYLNNLETSSNDYLNLCATILRGSIDGSIPFEVVPAKFNLAFLDTNFVEKQFKECFINLIKGYKDNSMFCPVVIDDVDVSLSYTIRTLSPEILRSIYGSDEDILSYFGNLDTLRYQKLMDALQKDRGVPCYEITYSIDYSYCTSGFYSGSSTDGNFFKRDVTKVTEDDVNTFGVKPNQEKYASENLTFKRIYNVF